LLVLLLLLLLLPIPNRIIRSAFIEREERPDFFGC